MEVVCIPGAFELPPEHLCLFWAEARLPACLACYRGRVVGELGRVSERPNEIRL